MRRRSGSCVGEQLRAAPAAELAGDGKSPPVDAAFAPCYVQSDFADEFGGGRGPQLFPDAAP